MDFEYTGSGEGIVPTMGMSEILQRIVAEAEIDRRDGLPLYAYRTSSAALEELRVALTDRAAHHWSWNDRDSGAFCLYAAERFCRYHEHGKWSWREVLDPIGFDPRLNQLYQIVRDGLRFWHRPVLSTEHGRQYLETLVCEGGLPLRLLRDPTTNLRRFLKAVIRDRETFTRTTTLELVQRNEEVLPKTRRNDIVRELAAKLVDSIVELRTSLGDTDRTLEALDRAVPGWESRVPLRIDDDVAKRLLDGLLAEPAVRSSDDSEAIRIATRLVRQDEWRIVRRTALPPEISAGYLSELIHEAPEEIPSRLRLHVLTDDGRRFHVATASRLLGVDRYRLERVQRGPARTGVETAGELRLIVSSGTSEYPVVSVEGGERLSELPWVFCKIEDGGELRAIGSVRSCADTLLVALPFGAKLEPDQGQPLGVIPGEDRAIYDVSGEVRIESLDDVTVVQTGQEEEQSTEYRLVGRRHSFGSDIGTAWKGLPSLQEFPESGPPRLLPPDCLQYRPMGVAAAWRKLDMTCFGNVVIRAVVDGETVFRSRELVLPAEARYDVRPGPGAKEGAILLRGFEAREVSVCDCPGATSRAVDGAYEIKVTSDTTFDNPTIRVSILGDNRTSAKLVLPYPTALMSFVRYGDDPLEPDEQVSLDQLPTLRAKVLPRKSNIKFYIQAHLQDSNRTEGDGETEKTNRDLRRPRFLAQLTERGAQIREFALDGIYDQIEALLASTADLDARVALQIISIPDEPGRPTTIYVGRFDARFATGEAEEGSADGWALTVHEDTAHSIDPQERDSLRVDAKPLCALGREPETLVRSENGCWNFFCEDRPSGPWLVTGWVGDSLRLRPTLLVVDEREDTPGVNSEFERIVRMRQYADRTIAFDAWLQRLEEDPGHAEWPALLDCLSSVVSLPPSSVEVIRRFVHRPRSVALGAILMSTRANFSSICRRIEELPFLWATLPIRSWVRAFRQFQSHLDREVRGLGEDVGISPDRVFGSFVEAFRKQAADTLPGGHSIIESVSSAVPLFGDPLERHIQLAASASGRHMLLAHLEEAAATVRRVHADDWWPQVDLESLIARHEFPREAIEAVQIRVELEERRAVLTAPVIAAAFSVFEKTPTRDDVLQLKLLRAYDEAWFETAYAIVLAQLVGFVLENEKGWLRDA